MLCQRTPGTACEKSTFTMSGVLKRKFGELEEDSTYCSSSSSSPSSSVPSSGSESEDEYSVSVRPVITNFTPTSILKKVKRVKKNNVEFDRVNVYYFPRCQGFIGVPSRGGCTLGMRQKHSFCREFTLDEFSKEQLSRRKEKLKERLKEETLMSLKNMLTMNGTIASEKANNLSIDDICDEDLDMTNAELEDGFSPRMYPPKMRRALLKSAGVKKIDKSEKHELKEIRKSREKCGCDCQDFCDPETCSCNLAGIKCQRDHSKFPCGCTRDGCGNCNGRVEFNSSRVQTHYIHTVMKLELEENQQNESDMESEASCDEQINPFACSTESEAENDERTVPSMPAFQFSMDLETTGENSCSSDTTDVSTSSNQSEEFEEFYNSIHCQPSPLAVDDDDLARILRLDESEYEETSNDCQDNLSIFHPADFFSDHVCQSLPNAEKPSVAVCSSPSSFSICMDENANQDTSSFSEDGQSRTISSESTDGTPVEHLSKSDTDSFLSDSFFQAFPDYNLGPLYNSLKEYENLDCVSFQLPNFPGIPQSGDQTTNFLESLISQSESIPDTLVPFTDNLFLEDAFKSSLMETMMA